MISNAVKVRIPLPPPNQWFTSTHMSTTDANGLTSPVLPLPGSRSFESWLQQVGRVEPATRVRGPMIQLARSFFAPLTGGALLLSLLGTHPVIAQRVAPVTFRLEEATIAGISAALEAGGLTCQQLVQRYRRSIAAYEDGGPTLNTITALNPQALATAAALDAERRRV